MAAIVMSLMAMVVTDFESVLISFSFFSSFSISTSFSG
jgi:hypothetical protein